VTRLVVGGTYRFKHVATKNTVAWNLTDATVTFWLEDPSGTATSHAATITDATGGVAIWDTDTTTLDTAGRWKSAWAIEDGGVEVESEEFEFFVRARLRD
jgi:hypothetical protein